MGSDTRCLPAGAGVCERTRRASVLLAGESQRLDRLSLERGAHRGRVLAPLTGRHKLELAGQRRFAPGHGRSYSAELSTLVLIFYLSPDFFIFLREG